MNCQGSFFLIRSYSVESPPFQIVASILRCSTALEFPKFREFAVHTLMNAWPDDLERFSIPLKWPEYAADTVSLGRQYNIPGVLKRALYELMRTRGFALVRFFSIIIMCFNAIPYR
jgi:hypothetical protein